MLRDKILNRESGYLFYGITPPKAGHDEEKLKEIAGRQISRLEGLGIDALILYDIQDETARTDEERPFPFRRTESPHIYCSQYLEPLDVPKIIYQSVGKHDEEGFKSWLQNKEYNVQYSVFVGAPADDLKMSLMLNDAYRIKKEINPDIVLGGVAIPERHVEQKNEHLRLSAKIENGCNFFVTQCVYSTNNAKNFLSDFYYHAQENNIDLPPIIFTLTPCGSLKTLEFMKWLGIDIPNWLNNELVHSHDILQESLDVCRSVASELIDFCAAKQIPIGFNIESVAIRKVEIEASIELLKDVKQMMAEKL
ncbi:MAG: methylenetetrahydrofolate reductase [Cyclobacteriaceae bacterium]